MVNDHYKEVVVSSTGYNNVKTYNNEIQIHIFKYVEALLKIHTGAHHVLIYVSLK